MAQNIKKINGVAISSIKKLNGLTLPTEFYSSTIYSDGSTRAYYRGENVNDSTGNGYDLTNVNSVAFNSGMFNNCFDLGSGNTTKYLTVSSNLSINSSNSGTSSWGGWFNFYDVTTSQEMLGFARNGYRQFELLLNNSRLYLQGYGNAPFGVDSTMDSLVTGTWYHLGFTANGSTVVFYKNGVASGGGTIGNDGTGNPVDSFRIGCHPTVEAGIGIFKADDVFVRNDVLSATEFATIYGNQVKKYMGVSNV
jgi:hypothetical protein